MPVTASVWTGCAANRREAKREAELVHPIWQQKTISRQETTKWIATFVAWKAGVHNPCHAGRRNVTVLRKRDAGG
jgi:hypothetical protein